MDSYVSKEREFINFMLTAPIKQCTIILGTLNKSQVNALSEIAQNVLYNTDDVDDELVKELAPYVNLLRRFGSKNTTLRSRREAIAHKPKQVIKILHLVEQILPDLES